MNNNNYNPNTNNNNNNHMNSNNMNNNINKPKPTPIDGHYVFGSPNTQPINPNLPIFPYNQPTKPPAFQQFPQAAHPGSNVFSINSPHNIQPQNPYNPPFVFGSVPFFNPSGTGNPPGGFAGIGQNPPNWYNKPPQYLPNQNPYNRHSQVTSSASASASVVTSISMVACLLVIVSTYRWRHS